MKEWIESYRWELTAMTIGIIVIIVAVIKIVQKGML
jgi:hypothetical protein